MDKKELRKAMKARNLALDAARRSEAAARVMERVEALPAFAGARCVALFCSLPDELPTAEAFARWRSGRRLAVPRVEGDTMRFFRYDPATMAAGAFGIEEPGPGAEECAPGEIDLMLVPGVAFTAAGARLGRGRGYYDRYLSQPAFRGAKVGVCYAHQLASEIPVEPHDVRMDLVVAG